ncbi:RNase H domain-containing protein [Colletotrichum navitas]|uniref:ribonuclease H n=1 Tax=Colletotrichum navitas TaxID=681940 RepID=A0AAD8Q529_9PEZI|nr:RNase H domain-containing protein [Colletotrichum navitas]KAK1595391.1 RNase H domain-containing protein [Colletotrichum navitas]
MPLPEIDYVDLPNGRTITVCAPHKMVTCGRCCLDFSFDLSDGPFGYDFNSPFPRDVSVAQVAASRYGRPAPSASRRSNATIKVVDDDKSNNKNIVFKARPEKTKHSGTVFPSKFNTQGRTPVSPEELFPGSYITRADLPYKRFINRCDDSECLIYTDGACSDNGAADARGGCAFVFKPYEFNGQRCSVAFKLEDRGPDGQEYRHTSNRAELRAVVAALRFRAWHDEGFQSIVIATDSTYVVDGATDWARAWVKKDWRLYTGGLVKNRDLWEALLLDVEKLHDRGVSVRFWKIPRHQNNLADKEAKRAVSYMESTEKFRDIFGNLV